MAVGFGLFLIRLWQPGRQVEIHSQHLLKTISDKDWQKFSHFIATEYSDQWGHNKAAVVERTRAVFRYADGLRVNAATPNVRVQDRGGSWRAHVTVEGDPNNELVSELKTRVNTLNTPFEMEWRHASGKPWDWQLVAVRNAELVLPP